MARSLRYLACAIAALTAVLAVMAIVVLALTGAVHAEDSWGLGLFALASLAPACIGLFVGLRQPGNRVAWILMLGALSVALVMTGGVVAEWALRGDPRSSLGAWAALLHQEWPVLFLWPLALSYVFPDGRLPSRRWRPVAGLAAVSSIGVVTLLFFAPELDAGACRARCPSR